jgi:phage shock protein A
MEMEQEKLTVAEQRLTAKVAAFRTKKETIKAQYNAAQAQVRIGEALSGVSEEMGDLTLAMERAENKTQHMRARAGAIDELSTIGMLDDFSGTRQDDISRELEQLTSSQNVEDELAAIRTSLPAAERPQLPESRS